MKCLAVASEIFPLVKTGGLADVVGALPAALAAQGIAVRTLVPGYPAVMAALTRPRKLARYDDLFGVAATVLAAKVGGLDLLVLDAPALFARDGGPYGDAAGNDWPDNWRRFAALGHVAADIAAGSIKGWRPDIVHAHDWQGAMAATYMRFGAAHAVPRVLTIHNLAFQGRFSPDVFPELRLPTEAWAMDGVEYYGGIGFLKAGLVSADAITTVSPSYADEIRTPAHGMGLDGLLAGRADRLVGIVNGIDTAIWDPQADPLIARPFSADALEQRMINRRMLVRQFSLHQDIGPIFIVVSRLTWQKGMDLLVDAIDRLVATGAQFAVLGSGDSPIEGGFLAAAKRHRGRVGVRIGYDEPLSHLMQAGGDAILIPSRFEPCGLTQLYGLRYGCVPVVARVGGLADTIIDANEAAVSARVATGLHFAPGDALALDRAVARTVALHADRDIWTGMQRAGMAGDYSWDRSAARYAALFATLVEQAA
jgi:starch synthase